MNFSIYLSDDLGKKLQAISEREEVSRNHLINEAIARLIEEREATNWGEEVLNWQGCPEFEISREDNLLKPKEDIF